jgi:hypothetical protein
MLILTDVDDTCLRFAPELERYSVERGWETTAPLRDIYSLEVFFGIPRDEAIVRLHEFIEAEGHRHPPEECAASVIPELHNQGYSFVAVTACGLCPVFRLKRTRNLHDAFGFRFDDVHVVDIGGPKTPILSLYEPAIWVEDHYGHAVAGAELGHRTFLIDRPYNRQTVDHPQVTRVHDWHEIAAHLKAK